MILLTSMMNSLMQAIFFRLHAPTLLKTLINVYDQMLSKFQKIPNAEIPIQVRANHDQIKGKRRYQIFDNHFSSMKDH